MTTSRIKLKPVFVSDHQRAVELVIIGLVLLIVNIATLAYVISLIYRS